MGFSVGQRKRQKHRLEDKSNRPGASAVRCFGHIKDILSSTDRATRNQGDCSRAKLVPLKLCVAYGSSRPHGGKVLRSQTWPAAPSANILDARGLLGKHSQRQGSAQDLPTTFTVRAIDDYHLPTVRICQMGPILGYRLSIARSAS
jgi:hypothetical protein